MSSITFLLGAGFSSPYGIPTMRPFLHSFRVVAKQKYPDLQETLERHFTDLIDESDIEALLSRLGKAERLKESLPPGTDVPEKFESWQEDSRYLKSHLISYIIERCERFERELAVDVLSPAFRELNQHQSLEQIHIFTTNYDRVVEHVCDASDIAFSDGFGTTGKELVARWSRGFATKTRIYKLHGSVTYYVDQKEKHTPIFWRLDRGYPLPGPDFRLSKEGNELEPLMVLPTLEKDALGDPYGHLNHLFTETMSQTLLVIAVGISLRDNHLISAINFNADKVVVLIVDENPASARNRIPNIASVQLKVDARNFFESSIFHLLEVIEICMREASKDKQEVQALLEKFAATETARISQSPALTANQRSALSCVSSSQGSDELLGAFQELHHVREDSVVEAVSKKCSPNYPVQVRKAAAACLGLSGNPTATTNLAGIAKSDRSSDVRLETYLALESIGTQDAMRALESAKESWPNDAYFCS